MIGDVLSREGISEYSNFLRLIHELLYPGIGAITPTLFLQVLIHLANSTEANMLLYRALTTGAQIATWAADPISSSNWTSIAASLKTTINNNLWDAAAGYLALSFPISTTR
jgi:hypothetical protein